MPKKPLSIVALSTILSVLVSILANLVMIIEINFNIVVAFILLIVATILFSLSSEIRNKVDSAVHEKMKIKENETHLHLTEYEINGMQNLVFHPYRKREMVYRYSIFILLASSMGLIAASNISKQGNEKRKESLLNQLSNNELRVENLLRSHLETDRANISKPDTSVVAEKKNF